MGNCIECQQKKKKKARWVAYGDDEEWEFESIEYRKKKDRSNTREVLIDGAGDDEDVLLRPLEVVDKDFDSGGGDSGVEIKIKISKKQLERMMQLLQQQQNGAAGSLQLHQVLSDLVSLGEVVVQEQEQEVTHWRPTLQSIAE